jgi:hypothetical protein
MAIGKLCAAPECGKSAQKRSRFCPMHQARLRRGGSLEPRQPAKPISELLGADQFGKWTVLGEAKPYERRSNKGHGRQRTALCRCSCGTLRIVAVQTLKGGLSRSCGCVRDAATSRRNVTHGLSNLPEYKTWCGMKDRCHNPKNKFFDIYGGRGIEVCAEWRDDFAAFFAHIGPKPSPRLSVDRIDVDRGYEPGNVRWATASMQSRNRRPFMVHPRGA